MGILDKLKQQTNDAIHNNQKSTEALVKDLGVQYNELIEKQNEIIKAVISVYDLVKANSKKVPEPLVNMVLEEVDEEDMEE